MIDWELAVKIACGGFGLVFILLTILCLSVWMTKLVVGKIVKGEPKK